MKYAADHLNRNVLLEEAERRPLTETELEKAMCAEFGCYFNPAHYGKSMTEWLHWVRDTLAKYAAEKAALENPESSGNRG